MWLVYCALFVAFIFILDNFLIDKRNRQLYKQFNGPLRLPLIGTIYIFLGASTKNYYDFIKSSMDKYARTKSKINYSWNFHSLELKVDDYKIIEAITTNQKFLAKSSNYGLLNVAVGDGLIFSKGQKWFNRRRTITPTFHFKILEQFFDVFKKQNQILLEKFDSLSNEAINILPIVKTSVFNSVCETAMGYEMKEKDIECLNAMKEVGQIVATRFLTPWQKNEFLFSFSSLKKRQDECIKINKDFTTKVIEGRRKILLSQQDNSLDSLDDLGIGLKKKMCLLDVLLLSQIDGKPLSNQDIQEEVDTFTFAGHDTTTIAICFTLYLIAKHPDVQDKLKMEIKEILGDEELTFKNLNDLKYLDNVIKETLRLYPPAPIISRRLYEEVDLGDFIAPANANYNLILYTAFRNPKVFKNPDDFIPDRFLQDIPTFAFIPFSAGQRNCIGQKFAMNNIKTNVIGILRSFRLIDAKVEPQVEINLTLKCDSVLIGLKKEKI